MTDGPNKRLPEHKRALLSVAVEHMSSSMQRASHQQKVYFAAFRDPVGFYDEHYPQLPRDERVLARTVYRPRLMAFFAHVELKTKVAAPGFSTFDKWHRVAKLADGNIQACIPRRDLQGPQAPRMSARVEEWLNDFIGSVWLTTKKQTKSQVHKLLEKRIDEWNDKNPDCQLKHLTKGHVARYIRENVDGYVAMSRREGKKVADQHFEEVQAGVVTTRILERVEVDNTYIKVKLLTDDRKAFLGYPWVTTALDHYSRMPLSLHVNFENQSLGSCFQALRSTMMPKGFLKKLVPGLEYDYPAGVPEYYFFDKGPDFNTDQIRDVGLALDVRMDYEPGERPNYKGSIERFWRTVKEDVARGAPGSQIENCDGKVVAGVDEENEVYLTFSEFVRRLWEWASTVYAVRHHRGIDDIPLRRWIESQAKVGPRALRKKDDLNILLTHKVQCVPTREGITYQGLAWGGDAVKLIRRHPSYKDGSKVWVRVDEYDVAKAWIINPFTLKEMPLIPKLMPYMEGLSLYAHDRVQKNMPKLAKGGHGSKALLATRRELAALAESLLSSETGKPGARNERAAKYTGVGHRAPAGDDLGSVLPHLSTIAHDAPERASPESENHAVLPAAMIPEAAATRTPRRQVHTR